MNIAQALANSRLRLAAISESAHLESRLLLSHIVGESSAWLYAHPETMLTPSQIKQLTECLEKRLTSYPLPYILGSCGFYHWEFSVNNAVLIPRPETELLVANATKWLQHQEKFVRVADIGTGSGIIGISLALLHPSAKVYALDISNPALAIAQANAHRLSASNIQFLHSNLLEKLPEKVDLIVANLPYIPTTEMKTLDVAQWEPHLALDGGIDGLTLIAQLLQNAPNYLHPQGTVMLEIGADQAEAVALLGQKFATITVHQDLIGRDRVVILEL